MTYAAPMKVSIRLIVWEKDEVTGPSSRFARSKSRTSTSAKSRLMTEHGTFIVNGTERVIVSQLAP